MKNLFLLALIALLTGGCQINVMQPDTDGDAVVPDANARLARKLFVGGTDGRIVYGEEKYEYDGKGLLMKISRLSRNTKGEMDLYSYDEYAYNEQQQAEKLSSYAFMQGRPFMTSLKKYDYPAANKIVEQTYAVNNKSEATFISSRTETTMEQGLKARVIYYYVNNQTFVKGQETVYRYEAGRLTAQESLNPNGGLGTTFRYAYKGRTATVEEYMFNRPESISSQSFQYDSRDRLTRSEVTKVNPLLCVAMVSGSATVYEYAD